MANGIPFDFNIPVSVFQKADAPEGKQYRIGGIISTESRDRQGEVLLQRGLDFSEFIDHGWFNDNHSKKTTDIVGYPDTVRRFRQGQRLPDGTIAKSNGTWAEGYLIMNEAGKRIWDTARALKKTGRRLGFSVEGAITKRIGELKKRVAKAKVRNVAVTNCPVNTDSRLEVLAKSLAAANASEDLDKAFTAGAGITKPTPAPGQGFAARTESLEGKAKVLDLMAGEDEDEDEPKKTKRIKKSMTALEAVAYVQKRRPDLSTRQAVRLIKLTRALKTQGALHTEKE